MTPLSTSPPVRQDGQLAGQLEPPGHRARSRRLYAQWCLFIAILLVSTTAAIGAGVDWLQPLPPRALFAALTVSSVLGAAVAGLFVWPWVVRPGERIVLVLLLYVAWRISYVPILQLAVLGAGGMNGLLIHWSLTRPWVYPTLLALLALLHLFAGCLAVWPLVARRPLLVLLAWPLFVPAALMACCDWSDLHPLPDRNYQGVRSAAVGSLPVSNPYREQEPSGEPAKPRDEPRKPSGDQAKPQNDPAKPSGDQAKPQNDPAKPSGDQGKPQNDPGKPRGGRPLNRRVRDRLSASVYDLRSDSPWMSVVQGTLERETRIQPPLSTASFLQRYYAALIVAHDLVGRRVIVAQRRAARRAAQSPGTPAPGCSHA